jgi:polyhydroxyalkanoate synthesis regulator phasin
MNPDNLPQMLQTGFHLTLGATSFLIETLQDPLKREENLDKLKSDLGQLASELLEKGEMTDREARNFVDTIFSTG